MPIPDHATDIVALIHVDGVIYLELPIALGHWEIGDDLLTETLHAGVAAMCDHIQAAKPDADVGASVRWTIVPPDEPIYPSPEGAET